MLTINHRTAASIARQLKERRRIRMNGQVLDYSVQTNSGLISGDDGTRYTFIGAEWKETVTPSR